MKYVTVLLLFITTIISCNNDASDCVYAYVGGEIINPNSEFVILERSSGSIDTLYLDQNNRFLKKVENLEPGLHKFYHGGEYQVAVIEPMDSLMVRLNTLDFDESLVFTGKGSKKNNYLIKLFLDIENENDKMHITSDLEPKTFSETLNLEKERRLEYLDQFSSKYYTSELFNEIAKATIDYNFYANKEMYLFRRGDYNIKENNELPSDFYSYRSDIDYNNSLLKGFYPYRAFLISHFNNLALDGYFKKTNNTSFNRSSLAFNMERIRLVDSLVKNDSIKNPLLKYTTREFITYSTNINECKTFVNSYLKMCNDEENKTYIKDLVIAKEQLQPGNKLPNISLINPDNKKVSIVSLINKPTVISFWSSAIKSHFKDNHKRISELKLNYPGIDFISININANYNDVWKQMLRQYKFTTQNEYKFANASDAKRKLALNYINKVILVDENSTIINSNANMFNIYFEEELASLK